MENMEGERQMPIDEKKKRPQDKWDQKAGVISKTYKVDRKTAEDFQTACKKAGTAMGTQLTNMMKQYINHVNEEHPE